MSVSMFWFRWAVGLALLLGAAQVGCAADEPTRTFAQFKCRYTLPDDTWNWGEKNPTIVNLFMAGNGEGLIVTVACQRFPTPTPIDANFGAGFESTFFVPGKTEKRGSRLLTFKNRPCFQAEALLPTGQTAIQRVFNAFGNTYHLTVLGGKEPIEQHPDFEKIVNGFDFTEVPPPDAPSAAPGGDPDNWVKSVSQLAGKVACICFLIALVATLATRLGRKKKKSLQ